MYSSSSFGDSGSGFSDIGGYGDGDVGFCWPRLDNYGFEGLVAADPSGASHNTRLHHDLFPEHSGMSTSPGE
jgi:hypothetical protein